MKVYEICDSLEKIAPLKRQEDWDNCGLLIGEIGNDITGILICLDVDMKVLHHASAFGYNFVISHHPMIFKGIKRIAEENMVQKMVAYAIKERISIYSMHTNYDFADYAMNDHIAKLLGLEDIGGYAMDQERGFGMGRKGIFPAGIPMRELVLKTGEKLGIDNISYTGDDGRIVYDVLISTGAFDISLIDPFHGNVDVVISGDIKYHAAKELLERGIFVIDAGHFGTEIVFSGLLQNQLSNIHPDVKIDVVDFEKDVFKTMNEQTR
jgi:GTP cyclohydrolase I